MGVVFNEVTKLWDVSYAKRHPITRMPTTRRRIGIKSKVEANKVYRELIIAVEDLLNRKNCPTWFSAIEANYKIRIEEGQSIKSLYSYKHCLQKHTVELKDIPINRISKSDLHEMLQKPFASKNHGHRDYILKCMRSTFSYALNNGYIQFDPTPRYKKKANLKIFGVLSEEQIKIFLNAANEMKSEWFPIWATALYTGMRSGELYALKWENVDLEKKQIKVKESWNKRDGFKSTKSGDDRLVDIAPSLLPCIQDLKELTGGHEFVFPRIAKWTDGEQAKELRMFLLGIGLQPIRFHDLRASWATILLNKGIAPIKIMAMGGWKDLKTMQIYIRKAGVDIKDSLNILNFS